MKAKLRRIEKRLIRQRNRMLSAAINPKSRYYTNINLWDAYRKLDGAINEIHYFLGKLDKK